MKILIVGAVAAGPKTACRARRLLPEAEITMIDQDRLISYGGCGIPYFISGDVEDEKELRSTSYGMVRDEDFFRRAKGVETRTATKAVAINRSQKLLEIEDIPTGERQMLPYDKLVLATGSSPVVLPLPGRDLEGVYALSGLDKAIALKNDLAKGRVSKAVIIGGGGIGIEMAEALADMWGVSVTILELMPQLLPGVVSPVLATILAEHLKKRGVEVRTDESVQELVSGGTGRVGRVVTTRREIEADLVIMAAGVRPRSDLALAAGLAIGQRGGILVDGRMRTSDPDIYAAGDCVEITHLVTGGRTLAPLGSLANRQGRVLGDNLAGIPSRFDGWVGSFIMKVFDLSIGATGISAEVAAREGFRPLESICISSDRAHFFPEQQLMFLNMITNPANRQVLGLQGIGTMGDGLLARINAAAGLIARKASLEDFGNLEMAYAPPFATAVDILNTTAHVADNMVGGRYRVVDVFAFVDWVEGRKDENWLVVDLRYPDEAEPFIQAFPGRWLCLPYDQIRQGYQSLPRDKTLVLLCNSATRAYEVQCFLDSAGIADSLSVMGAANILRRLGLSWWPEKTG